MPTSQTATHCRPRSGPHLVRIESTCTRCGWDLGRCYCMMLLNLTSSSLKN